MTEHDRPAPTVADIRALHAAVTEAARRASDTDPDGWPLRRIAHPGAPPGYAVYRAGPPDGPGMVTMLPALLPTAPDSIQHRYLLRVLASLTGRCELCGAVAGITADSPQPDDPNRRAMWHVLPVHVGVTHDAGCPAMFSGAERRWFDPRGLGTTDDQRGGSGHGHTGVVDGDDTGEPDR
jgi:hypothetical protein